jgi:hypothetical protein
VHDEKPKPKTCKCDDCVRGRQPALVGRWYTENKNGARLYCQSATDGHVNFSYHQGSPVAVTPTVEDFKAFFTLETTTFPVGAKVYVDGRDLAVVKQAFPEGSSSFLFPHYKLDIVDGDLNVAVALGRVGVDKRV